MTKITDGMLQANTVKKEEKIQSVSISDSENHSVDANAEVMTQIDQIRNTSKESDSFTLLNTPEGKSYGQFASFCFGEDDHIYIALGNYTNSQGGIAKIDKDMNLVKMNATYPYLAIEYCYGKIFVIDGSYRTLAIYSTDLVLIKNISIGVVDGQKMFRVIDGELYYLSKLANEWNLQKIDEFGNRTTIINYGATEPSDFRELYGSIYVCVDTRIEVYNLAWEKQTEMLNVGNRPLLGFENNEVDCLFPSVVADSLIAFSEGNMMEIANNSIISNVEVTTKLGYGIPYKDKILYGALITQNQYLLITYFGFMIHTSVHPASRLLSYFNYTGIAPAAFLKHCLMKDGFLYYSYGRKLIKHQIA